MRLAVISFTKAGSIVCGRLVKRFRELGETCSGYAVKRFANETGEPGICPVEEPVGVWSGRMIGEMDGIIYIGAAGIAVRAIAPYIKDKMTDPAVLVIDEQGKFVISLLSGHVGGANELTLRAAEILGAQPVITTASDVQGRIGIDVWAKKHGMALSDRGLAKEAAAALVNGEPVGFYSDYQLDKPVPEGYARGQMCRMNIWVTCRKYPEADNAISMFLPENAKILRLIPGLLTVGIGCRKGVDAEQVEAAVRQAFQRHNLELRGAVRLTSIDLKREEPGILQAAKQMGLPFITFSAGELEQAEGTFSESEFVRKITGTGNVCERAALLGAGAGARLLARREVYGGVTVAIAESACTAEKMDKGIIPDIVEAANETDR